MALLLKFGAMLMMIFAFIFYTFDLETMTTSHIENNASLDRAVKTAMSQAVELGTLRVNETIAIDPEIAEEVLVRSYADNLSLNDEEAHGYVYVKEVSSHPPMLAAESVVTSLSYFQILMEDIEVNTEQETIPMGFSDDRNGQNEKLKNRNFGVSRSAVIYEARCTNKVKGGIC